MARVSVDSETKDPDLLTMGPGVRRGGYVVGYSFAFDSGPAYYVPIRHEGGDNVEDPDQAIKYLQDQAKHYKGEVCGANLSYDLDYFAEMGVVFPQVKRFRDVQVAEPLLNELRDKYSLEAIAGYYNVPGKDESLLNAAAEFFCVHPKNGLWRMPARFAGLYGEQDSAGIFAILDRQERLIDEEGLREIYDLECDLIPVLVKMTRRGVRINESKLDEIEMWSLRAEQEFLDRLYHETGCRLEVGHVWRAAEIAPILEKCGVKLPRTAKTDKPSVTKAVVAACEHPAGKIIQEARAVNKIRTTFVASIRRFMIGDRIHFSINQMARDDENGGIRGPRYGRMSMEKPNMQQQPKRGEFAKTWRQIYVPERDTLWARGDFSQQEPRMLTHYAYLAKCPGAENAVRRYREDPNMDNHKFMMELTGLDRDSGKIIFLGKCYGMGGAKMCRSLGLPTVWKSIRGRMTEIAGPEGQAIADKFDERVPYVTSLARKCSEAAERRGFIRTIGGRKCRFPRKSDGSFDFTFKAMNRLIQGSSADQMKRALVNADREGLYLQLQVHDEMDLSVTSHEEAFRATEIMVDAYKLEVPTKVEAEVGPNWGSLEVIHR